MKIVIEKPCPFCKESELFEFQRGTPEQEGTPTAVMCGFCGATGPSVFEQDDNVTLAIRAWEDRE